MGSDGGCFTGGGDGGAPRQDGQQQKRQEQGAKAAHAELFSGSWMRSNFICGGPAGRLTGGRMAGLPELTAQLAARRDLTAAQVADAARALATAEVPDAEKEAFLLALADKGETAVEVAEFARAFRALAVDPGMGERSARAIDVVGTGGDHAGGFNVSSVVTLVLACAGVPVMKHGNRGITSKCGSADLLAALGVRLDAPPETLRKAVDELGFCFFFAPSFHPAFKHVAPVRKALAAQGRRTVFNLLGPLINPGRPAHGLVGVFAEAWVPRVAEAFGALGATAGLVAHGVIGEGKGIDELTTATANRVRGCGRLAGVDAVWRAEDFGLRAASFDDLRGGDLAENLKILDALLDGHGPAGLADTIALNAAVAMWIVGQAPDVRAGLGEARALLTGGAVKRKIADTREFFTRA
jgi:anthranilate phosphoribosyltransferase